MATPAAPSVPLLFQHTRGGFSERGYSLSTSLLGKRVSALTGQLAVDPCFLPGLGQGDEGDAAKPELPATATDDEALNPAAGTGRLNKQVQSVSIGVFSGRSGAQEGGREGVAGVAAGGLGLGSGPARGCLLYPSPHYMGDVSGIQGMLVASPAMARTI